MSIVYSYFILTGIMIHLCIAAPLAEYSGNESPDFITKYLSPTLVANVGQNPNSSVSSQGYWVSAATTGNDGAPNTSVVTSFSYTATGLAEGETITLEKLTLDYSRLSLDGSTPIMNVYTDEGTGYGAPIYTVNDNPTSSNVTDTHIIPVGVTLSQGEQVTIGFAFSDQHGLASRTHILDNFILQGSFSLPARDRLANVTKRLEADIIARLSGEATADMLHEQLSLNIGGNSGRNPDGSITDSGYWTSASTTGNNGAPSSVISSTFEITGSGLSEGDTIILSELSFDYNRFVLNGTAPVMKMYVNTGSGYGAAIFTENSNPPTSSNYNRFTIPFNYTVGAGETITIGIAFSDNKSLASRTHIIDDLVLKGRPYILSNGGTDFNGNGVSDLWERRYGATELISTELAKQQDADGDGVSNYNEFLAGTNPYSARSKLEMRISKSELDELGIIIPTIAGKAYRIQVCENLAEGNWLDAGELLYGANDEIEVTFDPSDYSKYFFRSEVIDLDADNDGLTLWEEEQLEGFSDESAVSNAEIIATTAGEEFTETDDTPTDQESILTLIEQANAAELTISIDNDMLYEREQIGANVTITRTSSATSELLDLETVLAFEVTNDAVVTSNGVDSTDYLITNSNGQVLLNHIVTLRAGSSSTTFTITLVDDGGIESDEVFTLSINVDKYQDL